MNAHFIAGLLAFSLVAASPACSQTTDVPRGTHEQDTARPTPKPRPQSRPAIAVDPALAALHARFTAVLKEAVTKEGLVRYGILERHANKTELRAIVAAYATVPVPSARNERLALWCNAYNANVLSMVLDEWQKPGFKNVVKVNGFFDQRPIRVAGETLTLNALENSRVRPLGDARIHAALVCAAMSCPPLRVEAYTADRIGAQLDDQSRRWINDPTKFRIDGARLGASAILNWYGDDFKAPPYSTPTGYILAYAKPGGALAKYIVNSEKPQLVWLDYDWTLNRAK